MVISLFFYSLVGDELDSSDTHQAPSNDYENETVVEMEENAPCQDSFSDGADNTFNTPIDDAEEVEQTRPHLEEDSSADDDIADPDYKPSVDESSAPENEKSLGNTVQRKINKRLRPGTWKQNESKEKRLKGMPYNLKGGKE